MRFVSIPILVLTTALFLASGAAFAGPNASVASTDVGFQAKLDELYGRSFACADCHAGNGIDVESAFGMAIQAALTAPLRNADSGDPNIGADIRAFLQSFEGDYAPSVSTVAGQAYAGTPIVVSPDQPTFTIQFSPGRDEHATTSSLASLGRNPVGTPTDITDFASHSGNSAIVSLSGLDAFASPMERAVNRRAGQPYTLTFEPRNEAYFKPTSAAAKAVNLVQVHFDYLAPIAEDDDDWIATTANASLTRLEIPVLINDTDPDSVTSDLVVSLVSDLTNGATDGILELEGQSFFYTLPDPVPGGLTGTSFAYQITDGEGNASNVATVTIAIQDIAPSSGPPVANDDAFAINEDTTLSGDVTGDNGSGADTDPDGLGTLSFRVTSAPAHGQLDFSGDGTFDYTPDENENGLVSFEYQAFDGSDTDSATVTITIAPVNDPPVAEVTELDDQTEADGDLEIDLLSTEFVSEVDGDTLRVRNVTTTITPSGIFKKAEAIDRSGALVTVSTSAFSDLDGNEVATITIRYDIDDGVSALVPNTVSVSIIGFENSLGRIAGQYADSIAERYNNHFAGTNQANASCHTCHVPGRVGVEVRSVAECSTVTPPVFNAYGLELCLDREPADDALVELRRRMSRAEKNYAPLLSPVGGRLTVPEDAQSGATIGDRLTATPGRKVDGSVSEIVEFLIAVGADVPPATTDASGQFMVTQNGQLRVAPNAMLVPGEYPIVVLPVNDAGQRDANGHILRGVPGFYPVERENQETILIEVQAVRPVTVADSAVALEDTPITLDLTANDSGGRPAALSIIAGPTQGQVNVNRSLTVTYTPAPGYVGQDVFSYVTRNSAGASEVAQVTIEVFPEGSAVAIDDRAQTVSGATLRFDVLDNDLGAIRNGSSATRLRVLDVSVPARSASAKVTGQWIEFTSSPSFTGTATVTYQARNPNGDAPPTTARLVIDVSVTASDVLSASLTDPELIKVAKALDQSCNSSDDTQFLAVCGDLIGGALAGEDLSQAMRALRNEEHLIAVSTAMTNIRGAGRGLFRRLNSLSNGDATGFDLSGMSLTVDGENIPAQFVSDLFKAIAGLSRQDGLNDVPWGMFVAGDITIASTEDAQQATGTDTLSGHLLIGADIALDAQRNLGAAVGLMRSSTDFGDGGGLDTNGAQISIYGSYDDSDASGLSYSGYLSVGRLWFDGDRRIAFSINQASYDTTATAQYQADFLNFVPRLSYHQAAQSNNLWLNGTDIQFSLGLDYLRLNVDGYDEKGGDGLALRVRPNTYQSLRGFVSADARRAALILGALGEIRASLSLDTELLDEERVVTSSFIAAGAQGATFDVTETGTAGFAGALGLGITLPTEFGALVVDYDYGFGDQGYRSQSVGFGYKHVFRRDRGSLNLGVSSNLVAGRRAPLSAEATYQLSF